MRGVDSSPSIVVTSLEHYSAYPDLRAPRIGAFGLYNLFRAPKSLPILTSSKFVEEKGFPVVKALTAIKSACHADIY